MGGVPRGGGAGRSQITVDAARVFEACYVRALFGRFAPWLVEVAGLKTGGLRSRPSR